MKAKAVSATVLIVLLTSVSTLVFDVHSIIGSGIIHIRADGSISPSTAPISTADYVTYTFAGNTDDSVVVERNNIVLDGAGYTLQGTGATESMGISLFNMNNVTIKRANIKGFGFGIFLDSSSGNSISGNTITANNWGGIYVQNPSSGNSISGNNVANNGVGVSLWNSSSGSISGNNIANNGHGVYLGGANNNAVSGNNITANSDCGFVLYSSSGNSISGNNMANNEYGIYIYGLSSHNSIFHNNFINNGQQAYSFDSVNVWDDGYPSGGNCWSDYVGDDLYSGPYQNITGSDGIGDVSYVIDADNRDRYPLVDPWVPVSGDVNSDRSVDICDIILWAHAFGCTPLEPDWDLRADLVKDNVIDIYDAVVIAVNFGKTDP